MNSLSDDNEIVIVSMNPGSGATDRRGIVDQLVGELSAQGFDVLLLTDIGEVISVAEEHFGGRLRCVVAAGGDGTISLLANCLPNNTPIAIFPLGTENLLAKYLSVVADPKSVCKMIVHGNCRQLDVGRANGKLFLVMASCGFDADVVQRLHSKRSGHIRHWSYAKPVMNSIQKYKYPKIQISMLSRDGQTSAANSRWAFVFNVPRYAMNLPIMPDADPEDGQLDLCTFRGGSLFRGLFYIFAVVMRKHRSWTNSKLFQFKKLNMTSDAEVPYQLDGDPGGVLPLEIEVVQAGVTIVVPE
jgi:diacylglycerol kinase family enzyme